MTITDAIVAARKDNLPYVYLAIEGAVVRIATGENEYLFSSIFTRVVKSWEPCQLTADMVIDDKWYLD